MKPNAIIAAGALSLIFGWNFSSQAMTQSVVQYQAAVLSKANLISHYTFDGTNANDNFGTNNGTLQGAAGYTNGIKGGADVALNLDGSGWDNLGSVSAFDFTNGIGTVELWLQAGWTNTPSIYPCIFANRDGGGARYSIHMSPTKTQIAFWNGTNAQYVSLPAYAGTNWHRLAVEFNSGNWTVIWDGQSLATNALPLGSIGHPVALGNGFVGDTEQWIGKLDEIKFYNAAGLSEPHLISCYSFDDSTANDDVWINNGTLQGAAYFNTGVGGGSDASIGMAANGWDNLGSVPDFDFSSGSGTVELWLLAAWTTAQAYYPCLFADRDGGGSRYSIHMSSDKTQLVFWNGTNAQSVALPANAGLTWHHCAVAFNSGNWSVVWDGQSVGTNALPLGSIGHPAALGNGFAGDMEEWYGFLDEVAFYNSALQPGCIQSHYSAFVSNILPVIFAQPQGGSWLAGQASQLSITVNPLQQPHYQWYKNNNLLAGATNSVLSSSSLALTDAGTYTCVVTNYGGSVTSSPAVVWVSPNSPAGDYQAAVLLENSLISYYKFDARTANDDYGTNNGVLHGTANYANGFGGGPDLALNLDGTSGWDNLGVVPAFDFSSGKGTVELWVKASAAQLTANNYGTIIANGDGTGRDWSVHLYPGAGYLLIGPYNYTAQLPTTLDTNWHQMALIFTNSTLTVVWDGQVLNWSDGPSPHAFTLGAEGYGHTVQLGAWGGAIPWGGELDEVAFYSAALPVSIIQRHRSAAFAANNMTVTRTAGIGLDIPLTAVATNWSSLTTNSMTFNSVSPLTTNSVSVTANGTYIHYPGSASNVADQISYTIISGGVTNVGYINVAISFTAPTLVQNYQAAVLAEPSLISYYQFDDGTANDDYGTNNGVLHGTANYANGFGGGPDLALSLDGTSGWDNLGVVPAFDFSSGKGTVELWVKASAGQLTANNYATIIANGDGTGRNWSVHLNPGAGYLLIGPANIYAQLPATLDTNWHQLALIFTNSTLTVVWDGQSLPFSDGQTPHPFTLGAEGYGHTVQLGDWTGGAGSWGGELDEVAFYSTALLVSSVQAHYAASKLTPTFGVTSSENPSGYKDSVSFTTTVTGTGGTPTGSVVFSSTNGAFSTNSLSSGSATSLSITNLPRGTNVITVAYLGDGNYIGSTNTLNQIVTNHPPVVNGDYNITRNAGLRLHIAITNILKQVADADGDTISLTGYSVTTNNVTLSSGANFLTYTNAPNVNDRFSYTVSDGYGGTATGYVNVNILNGFIAGTPIVGQFATNSVAGAYTVKYYGVIGYQYVVQRSTDLSSWENLVTNTMPTNPPASYTDTSPPMPTAYYRVAWKP